MDGEAPLEPDSTTVEQEVGQPIKPFAVHDDVLCQSKRGNQFSLAVVVQVNELLQKCLVKYLDTTETWCKFKNMKLLSQPEDEVRCIVCKSSQHNGSNQVHVCPCGRGYHLRCHQPHIVLRDSTWKCRICSPMRYASPGQTAQQGNQCQQCMRRDVWYRAGMLECRRCREWYHASCLTTLKTVPLHGDRFFLMICSGCNRGQEICRRLSLTWEDLVHLVLFNLNLLNHNKYHDLETSIVPYIKSVWDKLQLPSEIANFDINKLRSKLESVLKNCTKQFRNGRETNRSDSLWGLRLRGPPRPPFMNIPPKGPLDEHIRSIEKMLVATVEQPLQNGHINSSRSDDEVTIESRTEKKVEICTEFHGRGLVKRSVPFPQTETANSLGARYRSKRVRRAARLLLLREKHHQQYSAMSTPPLISDSEDDETLTPQRSNEPSRSCTNQEEDEEKNQVRKRPRRNLLEARLNSTENKLYNPKAPLLGHHAELSSKKKIKKLDSGKAKGKLVQKPIFESQTNRRLNAEVDSPSSSDERYPVRKSLVQRSVRRLSAKDIFVDEHGVVRRRRRFRRASTVPVVQTPKSSLTILVPPPLWFRNLLSGQINKEAVKSALGPMARVIRGQKYEVVARRVLPDGQVELLVNFPP